MNIIDRKQINDYALKVLYRLTKNGFQSYLVGGGIRDLLLDKHPKDFDIVTDATPEEVRAIFSNCRVIGRRFRLAHVFFGEYIIEVATFRGNSEGISAEGMILRDNVYGSLEEDAFRRDFTINALYYNIVDSQVVDYTGGLADLEAKQIRMIGEPSQRLREDPVRMLRAIRFAVKLDFSIVPELAQAISVMSDLLRQVSAFRLFEEILKLFHTGGGLASYHLLKQYHLFVCLFPLSDAALTNPVFAKLVEIVLAKTDERFHEGKSISPAFLFSALLWGPLCEKIARYQREGENNFSAYLHAMESVIEIQNKHVNLPKRLVFHIKDIWVMSFRLENKKTKQAKRTFEDQRFRAAYDLLMYRAQAGEPVIDLANWWTAYTKSRYNVAVDLPVQSSSQSQSPSPYKSAKIQSQTQIQTPVLSTPFNADSPFSDDFHFEV